MESTWYKGTRIQRHQQRRFYPRIGYPYRNIRTRIYLISYYFFKLGRGKNRFKLIHVWRYILKHEASGCFIELGADKEHKERKSGK